MDIFRCLLNTKASDNNDVQEITETDITSPETEFQYDVLPRTSANLMKKLFRFPKLSHAEPPEFLYENEAWSPNRDSVSLFHKSRSLSPTQERGLTSAPPQ
ncbi:hypothetical protein REC12_19785 [Desulfosporosinus sp. PR]|uniref:hypothetical protein n=1 Tax=Candidatus Desulfosporosinus nitrosoreducens TaxID=3401928 RepID=UPI0027E5D820|nr:hypothetical protein [Desulfosporosinus sp. PR]MDQ7095838.1 hypothetical protein [Desulfosporosinus sp. PR]